MANILVVLVIGLSLCYSAYARPADLEETTSPDAAPAVIGDTRLCLATAEDTDSPADEPGERNKRSAEESEDLETAAGTNVLRPLFVYRQQLAYRERVKGAIRRSGIRPRF